MIQLNEKNKLKKGEVSNSRSREMKISFEPWRVVPVPDVVDRWYKQRRSEIYEYPKKAIPVLEGFLKKYPDHPVVLNWLSAAYENNNQREKSVPLIIANYQKHPNYLFALCCYALYQIRENNHEIVPELLHYATWLGDLYPDREVFHISEVSIFNRVVGLYFIKEFQFDFAREIITMLRSINEDLAVISVLEYDLDRASIAAIQESDFF